MGKQAADPMRNRLHMYKEASRRPVEAGREARRDLHSQDESNTYIHASQAVHYSR
jgi:hypothetical protein